MNKYLAAIIFLILKYLLYLLIAFVFFGFYYLYIRIPIIAGYTAKCACTQYYHNQRDLTSIQDDDFDLMALQLATITPNESNKTITSSVFGLRERTAIYKRGLGCQLLQGEDDYNIKTSIPNISLSDTLDWPYGTLQPQEIPIEVNQKELQEVVDFAFDNNYELTKQKTRSLLVVYKDTIILDVNQKGFDADTPQLGWSMTKSWMNTLIGMQVMDKQMSLKDDHLFENWKDERSEITLDHLLTMTTGIDWEEEYATVADATEMLYMSEDIVSVANDNKLKYSPGEQWYYSSGTTNMLSGILRQQFENVDQYLKYPHQSFFNKLGMSNSFMEVDEKGNFIGSSYGYASTNDWAKFGLLYLHDGIWNNERLLPENWVEYSTTEVPSSNGKYGAHFWLNKRGVAYPDAPYDTYSANGYNGQKTIIIPSRDLVIVRLGLNSEFDFNRLIKEIIDAIDN